MSDQQLIYHREVQYGLALGTFLLVLALCVTLSLQRSQVALDAHYNSYQCETGGDNAETFRVLTLTSMSAIPFANALCASEPIQNIAGRVEITWYPRGYLTAQHIVDRQFDLIWNRQHVAYGLVPELDNYYHLLVESPRYALVFASWYPNPVLQPGWLADKRVGLLSDTHSQSFFQQPVLALGEAGIELNNEQKAYFADTNSLLRAFETQQVDLMSMPTSMADEMGIEPANRLLISNNVPAGSWFLSRHHALNLAGCAVLHSLDHFALLQHDTGPMLIDLGCENR